MAKRPPIPMDPRDKIIDNLIDDKNRLYKETMRLKEVIKNLKSQKALLKSRLKYLQEKYSDRTNKIREEENYSKGFEESD